MTKPDQGIPAELAELESPARAQLVEFLRASCRQHVVPAEVEEVLADSLLLKESLNAAPRQ